MSETPPTLLPLLSRGRHRNPTCGACFMEYTALLAGEPFSDRPECVDATLASILRGANDSLSDQERSELVPFLGRAIGLVVPPDTIRGRTRGRLFRRGGHAPHGGAAAQTARLHAMVSQKLRAAVVPPTSPTAAGWHRRHAGLSETFWDLMAEPARARTSQEYSTRLVQRLELLHRCYEEALAELGLRRSTGTEASPTGALAGHVTPAGLPR